MPFRSAKFVRSDLAFFFALSWIGLASYLNDPHGSVYFDRGFKTVLISDPLGKAMSTRCVLHNMEHCHPSNFDNMQINAFISCIL